MCVCVCVVCVVCVCVCDHVCVVYQYILYVIFIESHATIGTWCVQKKATFTSVLVHTMSKSLKPIQDTQ